MDFYITGNSFAAPFFSDSLSGWVEADSPSAALEKFAADCKHPCGLYAANCYPDANAHSKGQPFLAQWLSNHVQMKLRATKGKPTHLEYGHGPGRVEIDHVIHECENPKGGRVFLPAELEEFK